MLDRMARDLDRDARSHAQRVRQSAEQGRGLNQRRSVLRHERESLATHRARMIARR